MSGNSPGRGYRSLPTFSSSMDSKRSTAASSSSNITSGNDAAPPAPDVDGNRRSQSSLDDGTTVVGSVNGKHSTEGESHHSSRRSRDGSGSFRRHRPKTSGGFLLDATFAFPKSPAKDTRDRHLSQGSRRDETNGNLRVGETGTRSRHKHRANNSESTTNSSSATSAIFPSPSTTDRLDVESTNRVSSFNAQRLSYPSPETTGSRHSAGSSPRAGEQGEGENKSSNQALTPFDMDPQQIVNLALNLSESRRRGSEATHRTASAGLPVSHSGLGAPFQLSAAGGSLKMQLQQQRHIPRNLSPASNRSPRPGATPPRLNSHRLQQAESPDPVSPFQFSEATLARAEKARATIELSVEYRRLLNFLPPLRSSTGPFLKSRASNPSSPTSSNPVSRVTSRTSDVEPLGRAYNPLQCIRNRRVRNRERKQINPESQGWANVAAVRSWVNTVDETHTMPSYIIDNNVVLPKFNVTTTDNGHVESSSPEIDSPQSKKYHRPRIEWMTSYPESLADAYWLEQDNNKLLIEDKDGNKTLSTNVDSARSPQKLRKSLDKAPRAESKMSITTKPMVEGSSATEAADVTFLKADRLVQERERGRHRQKIHDKLHHSSGSDGSNRRHQSKISRSPSSSSSRLSDGILNVLKTRETHADSSSHDAIKSRAVEKEISEMLEKEEKELGWRSSATKSGNITEAKRAEGSENAHSRKASVQSQARSRGPSKDSSSTNERSRRSSSVHKLVEALPMVHRSSLSSEHGKNRTHSGDDSSSARAGSPEPKSTRILNKFPIPQISLNISAPSSRQASPTRKPLPKAASRPVPNSVKRGEDGGDISENDFAVGNNADEKAPKSPPRPVKDFSRAKDSSRSTATLSRVDSPKELKRTDSRWRRSEKEPRDPDSSRMRGMFKGGRIEELVRGEVSRMGDYIWKREPPANASRPQTPASSVASDHTTSDDEDVDPDDSGGGDQVTNQTKSEKPTSNGKPKFFLDNLPVFRSPFASTVDTNDNKEADHITRQQNLRGQQRSPRFDELAPPKLDVPDASPAPKRPSVDIRRKSAARRIEQRRTSYAITDRQRGGNDNPSGRNFDPSSKLNTVLKDQIVDGTSHLTGRTGVRGFPVTGLTALDANERRSGPLARRESPQRQWSISDRAALPGEIPVTRTELARVRALLIATGVKASEIRRKATEDTFVPKVRLENKLNTPLDPVAPLHEHKLVADIIGRDIQLSTKLFETTATRFHSSVIMGDLSHRLEALQEELTARLTPLVCAAGDDADAFNAELTSTHTLAIKQLDDSLYTMMRRRRRQFRWVRRFGYVLLEWALLGLMWWVWLIVVVIRLVRGMLGGVTGAVRWLFWL